MNYYFLAQININDNKEYQKYLDRTEDIFEKYNGKYLSVDNNPLILEGNWNYTRTVLVEFKNLKDFNEWYNSPDYQEILKHRLNAADCDTILIKGID